MALYLGQTALDAREGGPSGSFGRAAVREGDLEDGKALGHVEDVMAGMRVGRALECSDLSVADQATVRCISVAMAGRVGQHRTWTESQSSMNQVERFVAVRGQSLKGRSKLERVVKLE